MKLKIFFCFFFNIFLNLYFVSLDSDDLSTYISDVVWAHKNTDDHEMCYYDITLWGAVCRRVIHHLRNTYIEYKDLYANYLAFNRGSKCELRNVRLPLLSAEPVPQNSLPCYARLGIVPAGMPNQLLQYHDEIIIFPYIKTAMMIFNRIQHTNEYSLFEFFRVFKWNLTPVDPDLFTIRIPRRRINIEEVYPHLSLNCANLNDESLNRQNIVHFQNQFTYYKLCRVLLNFGTYPEKIDIHSIQYKYILKRNKNCKLVTFRIPEEYHYSFKECAVTACECIGFIPGTKTVTNIFSVAATSDNNTVILLEKMEVSSESRQLYNLVEYFEDVHVEYLENYEHY